MSDNWEEILKLLARFVADDDAERARCGPEAPSLAHVERARALLKSVRFPHLATENARLLAILDEARDYVREVRDGDANDPMAKIRPGALAESNRFLAVIDAALASNPPAPQPDAKPTHHEMLLGQALLSVLVASGMIRPGVGATGPELLMFAEDYVRDSKPAPQPGAVKVLRDIAVEYRKLLSCSYCRSFHCEHVKQSQETIDAALAATGGVA